MHRSISSAGSQLAFSSVGPFCGTLKQTFRHDTSAFANLLNAADNPLTCMRGMRSAPTDRPFATSPMPAAKSSDDKPKPGAGEPFANPILRPIELPQELLGKNAPCDLFNARGVLLIKAGAPIPAPAHDPLWPTRLFCTAEQAQMLSDADPALILPQVGVHLSQLSARILLSEQVTPGELTTLAQTVFNIWSLDADACLGLARLSQHGQPSAWHAIHVALIAAELGTALSLTRDQITSVIGAALTMNLSTLALHDEMFYLHGAPSAAEREALHQHPLAGVQCLLRIGNMQQQWVEAVGAHHENIDGSGYPEGLKGVQIPLHARMVRVADTLAARLTGRKLRPPRHWNLHHARDISHLVQHIFGDDLVRLDVPMTQRLMNALGRFPPGSLVRLSNSELALVTRRTTSTAAPPHQVLALFDAEGNPYETPRPRRIDPKECSISGYAHDKLHTLPRYDWNKAWGYGLA